MLFVLRVRACVRAFVCAGVRAYMCIYANLLCERACVRMCTLRACVRVCVREKIKVTIWYSLNSDICHVNTNTCTDALSYIHVCVRVMIQIQHDICIP